MGLLRSAVQARSTSLGGFGFGFGLAVVGLGFGGLGRLLGGWLFARYDLERKTVTTLDSMRADRSTQYEVGGFMAGLALQVGVRLESPHPWNQGVVER